MAEGIVQKVFGPTIESYNMLLKVYSKDKGLTAKVTQINLKNFINTLEVKQRQVIAEIEKEFANRPFHESYSNTYLLLLLRRLIGGAE